MFRTRHGWSPRGAALAGIAWLLLLACASAADAFHPRVPPQKPARTRLAAGDDPQRIVIKFAEGSAFRSAAAAGRALRELGLAPRTLHRLFARPERDLDRLRERGERRGARALADLNLYYEITLPRGLDAEAACDALNALPEVELALPARVPLPAPVDLAPTTPSFVSGQGYRAAAPAGVGAAVATRIAGARGAGVAIVDVEYQWVLDHEDVELGPEANIETATLDDPFPGEEGSHGTATLSILRGLPNGYGVLGLVPEATLFVAPANTVQHGYDPARAIDLALDVLAPGDVLLLEQQTWVCGGPLGPLEGYPPWFDAIASATAQGIIVVEAAGNGSLDLDSPGCDGWFDRTVRDSGAILVGSGSPTDRSRLGHSTYGSRLDVQGWGAGVWSAGYGDLFDPGDPRQRYTAYFGGTSSGSAIVAGAVAAVQGAVLAGGLPPLGPGEMRSLLVSTGSPQSGTDPIGPLPDIVAALGALGIAPAPSVGCGLTGIECAPLLILLGRLRRRV
jgi:hypothetical protein